MAKKDMLISAIENGTVIDRIPASKALLAVRLLGLEKEKSSRVAIAMRVKSAKLGEKDILKIENRALSQNEAAGLGLLMPGVTISIIENFEVVNKFTISYPDEIEGILTCINPTCATNYREPVRVAFTVMQKQPLLLRCKFCDRVMLEENVMEQFQE